MSNRTYDAIKNSCLILTPIIILIMSLLNIFGVVDNEVSIAIASAIELFLGSMVKVAKKIYDDKNKEQEKKKTKQRKYIKKS